MLLILITGFVCSCILSIGLIRYQRLHAHLSADSDLLGIQKFHATPVPRIGGVPIMLGLLICALLFWLEQRQSFGLQLVLVSLPAFAAGLIEDLTKKVGPLIRLLATFVAAILGYMLLGGLLQHTGLPWLDMILESSWAIALLFTMIAVGGVSHSLNLIDGYNGISGMVSLMIFGALSYVAFKVGDMVLLTMCWAAVGSVAGFLIWNYPKGLLFAGDGGAYLLGFLIAELSVLLVARNPQVSPWFPMLLVIYPVFETVFSIYRRKFLQDRAIGLPDALHLHQIIYKRLVRWMVGSKEAKHLTRRNSLTAPYLWTLAALSIVPAMLLWQYTWALMLCVAVFVILYIFLYQMIVRFRTPGWLKVRKIRKTPAEKLAGRK